MASPDDDNEPSSPQFPRHTATDRSSADTTRAGQPEPKDRKTTSRTKRQGTHKSALQWTTGWETKGRAPYHDYIHKLVAAGWDNLKDVDEHMNQNSEDKDLVVSVVDILDTMAIKRRVDIRDVPALDQFLANESREGVKVRIYMAEQRGKLSSAVMESLGANLKLDPRFFQWNIMGSKNLMSPADRHRAPFTSVGFTVLDPSTPKVTDTFFFRTTIYIQPDEEGDGWTGVILFNSHLKTDIFINAVVTPPPFNPSASLPPPVERRPHTFRELYLSGLFFLKPEEMVRSPFYTIHMLFRLSRRCWSDVITAIREQDSRINGISEASVNHVEDIRRTFDIVKRGGSLGWIKCSSHEVLEVGEKLEEDFTHLLKQADFLWDSREKRAQVTRRKAEARWNALTNAFTFVFVPITVISGIYGMNVYEINGSTPDIWQFFVATAIMDTIIVLALAFANFAHIASRQKRKPGAKEIFNFAVGR
ncbi:hypothetical protein MMC34_008008 [Xylographa carneopallida]|nr:hypothetical protein [Xylographa carneopallida]